jgi:hypothetical protein
VVLSPIRWISEGYVRLNRAGNRSYHGGTNEVDAEVWREPGLSAGDVEKLLSESQQIQPP